MTGKDSKRVGAKNERSRSRGRSLSRNKHERHRDQREGKPRRFAAVPPPDTDPKETEDAKRPTPGKVVLKEKKDPRVPDLPAGREEQQGTRKSKRSRSRRADRAEKDQERRKDIKRQVEQPRKKSNMSAADAARGARASSSSRSSSQETHADSPAVSSKYPMILKASLVKGHWIMTMSGRSWQISHEFWCSWCDKQIVNGQSYGWTVDESVKDHVNSKKHLSNLGEKPPKAITAVPSGFRKLRDIDMVSDSSMAQSQPESQLQQLQSLSMIDFKSEMVQAVKETVKQTVREMVVEEIQKIMGTKTKDEQVEITLLQKSDDQRRMQFPPAPPGHFQQISPLMPQMHPPVFYHQYFRPPLPPPPSYYSTPGGSSSSGYRPTGARVPKTPPGGPPPDRRRHK